MESIPSSKTMICVAFEQPAVLRASINFRIRLIFQGIAHFVPGKMLRQRCKFSKISVTEEVLHMAGRCI